MEFHEVNCPTDALMKPPYRRAVWACMYKVFQLRTMADAFLTVAVPKCFRKNFYTSQGHTSADVP